MDPKLLSLAMALPALTFASAVSANCPTSLADTADGVHVIFSDFHVRYDRQSDGMVIEEEFYSDSGDGVRFVSLHGAYVVESVDTRFGAIIAGSNETTEYLDGLSALPLLAPGQSWQGNTVRTHEGGDVNQETVMVDVAAAQTLSLGACSLSAWPVVVTTVNTAFNEVFVDELTYLPALGIAIYHGGAGQGEAFTRDEPVAISTEPPFMNENGQLLASAPPSAAPQAPMPVPAAPTPAPVAPSAPAAPTGK